ncbi:hypothetical protein M9H77_32529 [Catharanthus roseus]|uniref:Uncharacterized protein n=1 Tax=Catharanthus roseus TaxID=4058 RepID=A0ACC0A4G1_CATRO|nr:hypothetical protein M9H77_32529 [Catharanthus roseus]
MLPDFSRNLVHVRYLSLLEDFDAAVNGGFGRCTIDRRGLGVSSDLGVVAYTYIAVSTDDGNYGRPSCSSWRNMWRVCVRDGPTAAVEALLYPSDEYIRWYKGITWVYIGNLANRDTRAHGYQPAGMDKRMMEVDDMASVAIREPSSSPSQMAAVMKKVQTIIRR